MRTKHLRAVSQGRSRSVCAFAACVAVGLAAVGGCETRDGSDRFFIPRSDSGFNGGDRGSDRDGNGGDGGATDFGNPDLGDFGGDGLTIYDLQNANRPGHPGADSEVEVEGIITAIDTLIANDDPTTAGAFFIQHPTGGAYSGIEIFNSRGDVDVTELSVGQTVRVQGTYLEFFGLSEIRVSTAEVIDASLTPLEPAVVLPADVATGGAQAEAFEGVLVTIEDVEVLDNGVGFGKFTVTGGLEIDDSLYRLPSLPTPGTTYESITGVLTYTFDAVQLLPRSADDFVGAGGGGGGGGEVTIYECQDTSLEGYAGENSTVTVQGVVTAIDTSAFNDDPDTVGSFWIQDPEGGRFSGIQVFNPGGDVDVSALLAGQTVEVTGQLIEFNGLTEIRLSEFTVIDETITLIEPEVVPAAFVATGGLEAEDWEGVLVTVEEVTVTSPSIGFGKFVVSGGLEIDDELYVLEATPAGGTTYEYITGVLTYSFSAVQILPRDADDFGPETTGETRPLRIRDIQDSTSEAFPGLGARVEVQGRVTAANSRFFWMQMAAGGPYSGIAVQPDSDPLELVAIGDQVLVTGVYIESFEQSVIDAETVEIEDDTLEPLPAEEVDPADVATGGPLAEAYEGVLVRVRDVEVTNNTIGNGRFVVTGGLEVDDFVYRPPSLPTVGTRYRRITGVLDYAFDAVHLQPRSADDLVRE
jgi:predicted extracellular nuclease